MLYWPEVLTDQILLGKSLNTNQADSFCYWKIEINCKLSLAIACTLSFKEHVKQIGNILKETLVVYLLANYIIDDIFLLNGQLKYKYGKNEP